jgi:hypothetical protein
MIAQSVCMSEHYPCGNHELCARQELNVISSWIRCMGRANKHPKMRVDGHFVVSFLSFVLNAKRFMKYSRHASTCYNDFILSSFLLECRFVYMLLNLYYKLCLSYYMPCLQLLHYNLYCLFVCRPNTNGLKRMKITLERALIVGELWPWKMLCSRFVVVRIKVNGLMKIS